MVAVFRRRGSRELEVGCFVVDRACLGGRDAWYEKIGESELPEFKERIFKDASCMEKEAAWGRKFVEEAVAYAQQLGFKPHRDYKKAARVFGGTKAEDCQEEFVFGKDGKPFYVSHPNDSFEQARAIIRQLEIRCGKDNFNYIVQLQEDTVVDRVDELLQRAQNGSVRAAKEELHRMLEQHPESGAVNFGLGVLAGLEGDNRTALIYLDEAVRLSPEMAEAWFNKGIAHQKLLQIIPMTISFQEALEFAEPGDGFVEHARDLVETVRNMARDDFGLDLETYVASGLIFDRGFQKMREQKWLEGIAEMRRVIELNPRSNQAFGNMGTCLIQLGRVTEAREALREALRLAPDYAVAKENLKIIEGHDDDNPPSVKRLFEANSSPETLM